MRHRIYKLLILFIFQHYMYSQRSIRYRLGTVETLYLRRSKTVFLVKACNETNCDETVSIYLQYTCRVLDNFCRWCSQRGRSLTKKALLYRHCHCDFRNTILLDSSIGQGGPWVSAWNCISPMAIRLSSFKVIHFPYFVVLLGSFWFQY